MIWSIVIGTIVQGILFLGGILMIFFLASLVIYSITAYVGPLIFRTGPWRRNGQDASDPAARGLYLTGYERLVSMDILAVQICSFTTNFCE